MHIDVLELGTVQLPDWHPRAVDGTIGIVGFAVHHPDGVFLVDTGVATDHELLNELYHPTAVPIVEALNGAEIDERDVVGIVNSHLHFDHCGQNRFLPDVPVHAQRAEIEAIELPRFTIPEWARIDPTRQRIVDGDEELAPGLHIVSTPGHTPGHQSVMIDDGDGGRTILVGQCCYTCVEFEAGEVASSEMHDESMLPTGTESLAPDPLALRPTTAYFSHDRAVFRHVPER